MGKIMHASSSVAIGSCLSTGVSSSRRPRALVGSALGGGFGFACSKMAPANRVNRSSMAALADSSPKYESISCGLIPRAPSISTTKSLAASLTALFASFTIAFTFPKRAVLLPASLVLRRCKSRYFPSIFAMKKMTIAPKTPPPASRYTTE